MSKILWCGVALAFLGAGPGLAQSSPGNSSNPLDPSGLTPYNLLGSRGQVTSGSSFNPAISVIPDIVFYRDSRDGGAFEFIEEADGFHAPHGHDEEGHEHGGIEEGFNLRETELAFSASVDPYFDVFALFAVGEEGIEAEEVYFQTRSLPGGLQLKGGKFLSGIGYINRQHPHQWDFVEQNLAYQLLLGDHGLNDKGLQLTWLPKLPLFVQVGVEALQGNNERLANYIGPDEEYPGPDPEDDPRVLSRKPGPRLYTGFVKVAPNLGYASALQLGLSYGSSRSHQEVHDEDEDGIADEVFDGDATFWGADVVYKYDSPRQHGAGDLTLQAEYLYREKDLALVGTTEREVFKNDGAYVQAVYGVAPRWQLAGRMSLAGMTNEVSGGEGTIEYDTSKHYSAALTFNPTEFSRVRVQYSRGDIAVGGANETFNQYFLQFQMSLGAHGAHRF